MHAVDFLGPLQQIQSFSLALISEDTLPIARFPLVPVIQ